LHAAAASDCCIIACLNTYHTMQVETVLDEQWKRALHFALEHQDKIEALAQELQHKQASTYMPAALWESNNWHRGVNYCCNF
jgi:hypothetical protein